MEKNVVVSIVGMHRVGDEEGQPQEIEVVSPGQYYEKGGKTYLTYSEFLDPNDPALETRATVKLEDGKVTLSRMGSIGTQMTFIQGQKSRCLLYTSPFPSDGQLIVVIVDVDGIFVHARDIHGNHIRVIRFLDIGVQEIALARAGGSEEIPVKKVFPQGYWMTLPL